MEAGTSSLPPCGVHLASSSTGRPGGLADQRQDVDELLHFLGLPDVPWQSGGAAAFSRDATSVFVP